MYFPYLTVRGSEAEAIEKTICNYSDLNVVPILEPFYEDEALLYAYRTLKKVIKILIENRKKFILVISEEDNLEHLKAEHSDFDEYCIRGIKSFRFLEHQIDPRYQYAVIHAKHHLEYLDNDSIEYHIFMPAVSLVESYTSIYPVEKTVLIEDAFLRYPTNSDYPDSDYFRTNLPFTYRERGILGFGDFTILEQDFRVAGAAKPRYITHVLHITRAEQRMLKVYHFLTTPAEEVDISNRSKKTLKKAYIGTRDFSRNKGLQMLEDYYFRDRSTSLAKYKTIGIINHIEVIRSLIL